MRGIYLAGLVILTVWLQASFLGALHPFGIIPNLALIFILLASAVCTASETVAMAVSIGLILDLASGADFGLRTAFFSLLALMAIMLRRNGADFERPSMIVAAICGGTVLYNAAVLASLVISHVPLPLQIVISRVAWEMALNIILVLLLIKPLLWLLGQFTTPFLLRRRREGLGRL